MFIKLEISLGGVYVHWTLSLREEDTKEASYTNEQSSFIYMYIPLLTNHQWNKTAHTHVVVRELELNLNEPRMCKWRLKDKESETQKRKQQQQWTTNEQPLDRLKQSFFTHKQKL